jgi:hypothetical protein
MPLRVRTKTNRRRRISVYTKRKRIYVDFFRYKCTSRENKVIDKSKAQTGYRAKNNMCIYKLISVHCFKKNIIRVDMLHKIL